MSAVEPRHASFAVLRIGVMVCRLVVWLCVETDPELAAVFRSNQATSKSITGSVDEPRSVVMIISSVIRQYQVLLIAIEVILVRIAASSAFSRSVVPVCAAPLCVWILLTWILLTWILLTWILLTWILRAWVVGTRTSF